MHITLPGRATHEKIHLDKAVLLILYQKMFQMKVDLYKIFILYYAPIFLYDTPPPPIIQV